MALSETDKQSLSAEQQAQIQALTDQWGALEAEKASASAERLAQIQQEQGNLNSQANAIRATRGYTGGADGVTVSKLPNNPAPNTVSGVTAPGTIAGVTAPETVAGVTAPNIVSGVAAPGTIAGVTAPNTVAGTNVAGVAPTMPNYSAEELMAKWKENMPQLDPDATVNKLMQGVTDPTTAKNNQIALLEQWKKEVIAQNNGLIDYNVAKAITELERALSDAQPQYKEQQESVAKDERQAMDNAALYAEVRGDKGGIGQAQYNAIQNTAAQNRLSIQQAQTKLSTDTQRQIADLRAQGEFDKADAALEVSQQYLSQLMSLEQWALDYGLTTAQFRASLEQWAADYKMAMAQFTTGLDQWAANYDLNLAQYKTANDQWNAQFQLGQEQWNKDFAFNQQQFQTGVEQWNKDFALNQQQFQTGIDQWNKEFQLGQQQFNTNVDQWNKEFQVGQQQFNTGVDQWNKNFQYSQQQDQTALEQWNKEFQLGQDQWNAQFQYAQQQDDTAYLQWLQELAYKKEQDKIANNQWQQTFDTNNSQWQQSQLASTGEVLLSAGIMPSASQLAAMNMSAAQAQDYITAAKLAAQSEQELAWAKVNKDSSGSGEQENSNAGTSMTLTNAKAMAEAGIFTDGVLQAFYAAGFNDAYLDAMYGYKPSKGTSTTDRSEYGTQYSKAALAAQKTAQEWIAKYGTPQSDAAYQAFVTAVGNALDKYSENELSNAGLSAILDMLGGMWKYPQATQGNSVTDILKRGVNFNF